MRELEHGQQHLQQNHQQQHKMFSLADIRQLVSGRRASVQDLVEHKAQQVLEALEVCPGAVRDDDDNVRAAEDALLGGFGGDAAARRRSILARRRHVAVTFRLYSRSEMEEELFELVVRHRVKCLERRSGGRPGSEHV